MIYDVRIVLELKSEKRDVAKLVHHLLQGHTGVKQVHMLEVKKYGGRT